MLSCAQNNSYIDNIMVYVSLVMWSTSKLNRWTWSGADLNMPWAVTLTRKLYVFSYLPPLQVEGNSHFCIKLHSTMWVAESYLIPITRAALPVSYVWCHIIAMRVTMMTYLFMYVFAWSLHPPLFPDILFEYVRLCTFMLETFTSLLTPCMYVYKLSDSGRGRGGGRGEGREGGGGG